MTETTARDLLSYLVNTFVNNDLSDIGTYLLPGENEQSQFAQNVQTESFTNSTSAILELQRDAITRPRDALRRLLRAAQEYFNWAATIPEAYSQAISTFEASDQLPINKSIELLGRDQESTTNVSDILRSTQLRQMQRLLVTLSERINDEDDSSLNDLDNL